jgi:hypothetical protein
MEECKTAITPGENKGHLTISLSPQDEEGKKDMEMIPYRQILGKLNFAMICCRPDIAFQVSRLSKLLAILGKDHWIEAKRVLRYLKRTANMCITYGREHKSLTLTGFCDADYAGDIDTSRSTTGYLFTLAGGPITWCSRLQPTTA